MPVASPPVAVKWVIVPIAVAPLVANAVRYIEPITFAPAARPIAEVATSAAVSGPGAVPPLPIAIAIEIAIAEIAVTKVTASNVLIASIAVEVAIPCVTVRNVAVTNITAVAIGHLISLAGLTSIATRKVATAICYVALAKLLRVAAELITIAADLLSAALAELVAVAAELVEIAARLLATPLDAAPVVAASQELLHLLIGWSPDFIVLTSVDLSAPAPHTFRSAGLARHATRIE
jgi:hypothetical protein